MGVSRGSDSTLIRVTGDRLSQLPTHGLISPGRARRCVPGCFQSDRNGGCSESGDPVFANRGPGFGIILRAGLDDPSGEAERAGDLGFCGIEKEGEV